MFVWICFRQLVYSRQYSQKFLKQLDKQAIKRIDNSPPSTEIKSFYIIFCGMYKQGERERGTGASSGGTTTTTTGQK